MSERAKLTSRTGEKTKVVDKTFLFFCKQESI